ncbi:uncharacterized protein LOC107039170 [Diachasma alloeum]|uniref:uncharacterized protein LOC107039170 n=1 Tax=Diachasma alloeum TaxID=454923 RepID=UPI0007384397|nr:uncharacterized protein LOC107039170 [Diachasma alloeum]
MAPRRGGTTDNCPPIRQNNATPKTIFFYPEEEEEEELLQQVLQILETSLDERIAARAFPTPPPTPSVSDDNLGEEVESLEVSAQSQNKGHRGQIEGQNNGLAGAPRKYKPWWCFKCHGFGHKFRYCPVTYWRIPFCKICGLWSYELLERSCPNLKDPRHRQNRYQRK